MMSKPTCPCCSGELSREEYDKHVRDSIRRHGRFLQGVFATKDDPGPAFTYTIGNWENHQLPELLVIGTSRGTYLNELSKMMIARGRKFRDGEIFRGKDIDERAINDLVQIKIIDADPIVEEYFTCGAGTAPVQQVILSDLEGRLPGDPECDEKFAGMPICDEKLTWLRTFADD